MNPRMHIHSETRNTAVSFRRSCRGGGTGSSSRIADVDPSSGVRSVGSFARPLPLSMCCASASSMVTSLIGVVPAGEAVVWIILGCQTLTGS